MRFVLVALALVALPIASARLPEPVADVVFEPFEACGSDVCLLARASNGRRGVAGVFEPPPTNGWLETGPGHATPQLARSAPVGHNAASRFSWRVEVTEPELDVGPLDGGSAALYVPRFRYSVHAEPNDFLTLHMTRVTVTGVASATCLTAPGSEELEWHEFNAVPDPTSRCSVGLPGQYTYDFVFARNAGRSGGSDAAFVDDLRLVRVGDDVCVEPLGASCHDAAGVDLDADP